MEIDSFFYNDDLSFAMDGVNGFKNFVGTGQNAFQKNRDGYKFAAKALDGFKDDPQYAQFVDEGNGISLRDDFEMMAGAGVGNDETSHFNAYGGNDASKFNDLRKKDREGHGIRKFLDPLSSSDLKDCTKLQATLTAIKNEIVNNNRSALESKKQERVMKGYNEGLGIAKTEIERLLKGLNCEIKGEQEFLETLGEINKGSKSSNYILYGGVAIAALGLGIVLYRALKK